MPLSTFHFQTAMNLLFCVWRPSKTRITAPPQRKRLYQSGPAERRSAGPILPHIPGQFRCAARSQDASSREM